MAFKTRLQIERKGFVDLYQDINIPVTKSLADIRDLSKRSGGYSTSIEVPATKNNMELFGHLYDLNITNGSFDIRRKYTCVVIQDDIQTFQGYIKMDSFNKYEGPDGETIITFNISLMDNVANFFGKIKDKFINSDENINNNNNIFGNNTGVNDFKNNIFWDDVIIPKYNYETIISTFDNTYNDVYKFFLPSQTKGYYETVDFKPCVYAYEYLNRIIEGVGYKWNGSKGFVDGINGTSTITFNTEVDDLLASKIDGINLSGTTYYYFTPTEVISAGDLFTYNSGDHSFTYNGTESYEYNLRTVAEFTSLPVGSTLVVIIYINGASAFENIVTVDNSTYVFDNFNTIVLNPGDVVKMYLAEDTNLGFLEQIYFTAFKSNVSTITIFDNVDLHIGDIITITGSLHNDGTYTIAKVTHEGDNTILLVNIG